MERSATERPTTEQPATEPSAAEQPATLADEELQEVAAGAAESEWSLYRWHHHWHDDDWLGWGDSHRGRF